MLFNKRVGADAVRKTLAAGEEELEIHEPVRITARESGLMYDLYGIVTLNQTLLHIGFAVMRVGESVDSLNSYQNKEQIRLCRKYQVQAFIIDCIGEDGKVEDRSCAFRSCLYHFNFKR